ncbi:phenylacetate--CoA ligase family protein [Kroppenstedtia pulmonis]|uniref:phenylacetate--CoA ligase family protein n=1 Tax=Kroppenstedtia pulmonis TaxID=1380685 RepID=UPI003CCD3F00
MFQREVETMSRKDLKQLQGMRLAETVERVFNQVPFYHKKLKEKGVHPEKIKTVEDVKALPFTQKKDLWDQYPFGLFAVDMKELARIHGSSGTKGKPTIVGYTRRDLKNWADMCARAIVTAGGRSGDLFHNAYGYGLFTGGLGLHDGGERLGTITIPVSGGNRSRQVSLIQDFKPRGIAGTPSFVLSLAETMKSKGWDPRKSSLEYGILGAEPWSEEMRHTLEETWGMEALDIYGLSEVMGPGVSIECREVKDGLHIAEDHFLVEVIHPKTLEPLPEGETGELVFTSLTKEALPVLRYRTGDIASLNREPCRCGRTHTRMSRIKGRLDDMLVIRGVNLYPTEIESVVLELEEVSPYYQLVIAKNGSLDRLIVEVEVSGSFVSRLGGTFQPEHRLCDELSLCLQNKLKESLFLSAEVVLKEPLSLPRSEGKAIRVLDRRGLETL